MPVMPCMDGADRGERRSDGGCESSDVGDHPPSVEETVPGRRAVLLARTAWAGPEGGRGWWGHGGGCGSSQKKVVVVWVERWGPPGPTCQFHGWKRMDGKRRAGGRGGVRLRGASAVSDGAVASPPLPRKPLQFSPSQVPSTNWEVFSAVKIGFVVRYGVCL